VQSAPGGYVVRAPNGEAHALTLERRVDGSVHAETPWGAFELESTRRGAELWVKIGGRRVHANVERAKPSAASGAASGGAGAVVAPMAGKLIRVDVKVGDAVKSGQPLCLIEAMKMENELTAPLAGVVVEIRASLGAVEKGALILRLEAP
jgi:biotin carboxyl carrier protein